MSCIIHGVSATLCRLLDIPLLQFNFAAGILRSVAIPFASGDTLWQDAAVRRPALMHCPSRTNHQAARP